MTRTRFFLQASQQYELAHVQQASQHDDVAAAVVKTVTSRFAAPCSEADVMVKIKEAVPRSTRRTTLWALTAWDSWREHRKLQKTEFAPCLDMITNQELNRWLALFVIEARNQNGGLYTGTTLYSLCAGIQRHVRERRVETHGQSVDIYKDPEFAYFRSAFDSVLKDLHRNGVGAVKKKAEIVSEEMEESMWAKGLLGEDTPEKLQNTILYSFGLQFALRSGQEHRRLCPDMIQIIEKPGSKSYLLYNEHGSKNNRGGLKERSVQNKSVKVFANEDNPSRCVVRLFKLFMSLRPMNAPTTALYLQPLKKPRTDCWYKAKPVGHNVLSSIVRKLCEGVGEGYFTNHSLRRTCATRLFQNGVDEQQIMSITGHRSVGGVRVYKEISHEQQEQLSDLIRPSKMMKRETKEEIAEKENIEPAADRKHHFNFSNCSVTFNYK